VAEKQFRRVQGHKQIPVLLRELEALAPSKPEVVGNSDNRSLGLEFASLGRFPVLDRQAKRLPASSR
jgi:hypothetical protein